MKIFAKIRFYWGAFVISFVIAVIMIPAIFLFNKKKATIMHHLNKLILFLMGAKTSQEGTIDEEADIYVMNHQGIMDIIAFESLQNNALRWVAKKELFDTIWYGNLLRWGDMISLDRGSRTGLIKLMKDVKYTIENTERSIVIFPEGTRAKDQKLLPFKQGTNMIAKKLKLKVQPIIITGSKWVLNEHIKTAHSGTIHYKFLDTIDVATADENWFEELHETMQKVIDDELSNNHRSR
ncbi:1-acyl-sn-glycerol-3-phosphate acyltransferase [hydrothermal vent metagenome]|uniref:1-acyl-sn-glycerol-3-phosphate acyltransferase n=1 Tax=hydrothermal vent metagenome TaxID=652676 RepID=A0A1W1EDD4_9ZZZZ